MFWSQITSNIKNTVTGLKAVLGKKYHSEEIQNEITKVAYNMTESLGNVTIPVRPPSRTAAAPQAGCSALLAFCVTRPLQAVTGRPAARTPLCLPLPAGFP